MKFNSAFYGAVHGKLPQSSWLAQRISGDINEANASEPMLVNLVYLKLTIGIISATYGLLSNKVWFVPHHFYLAWKLMNLMPSYEVIVPQEPLVFGLWSG
jgi:hypothetical protein